MIEAFGGEDAARGLLVTLLHLFNYDGGETLYRDEFSIAGKALGYDTGDEAWHQLCMRFWSSAQAQRSPSPGGTKQEDKELDLSNVAYHFRNKYDNLLEEILRQTLRGLTTLSARMSSVETELHAMRGASERDRKTKMNLVLLRLKNSLLVKALEGWKKMAKGQVDLRNRFLRRLANQTLARLFFHWRDEVLDGKSKEQVLANVLGRLKHRTAAMAFEAWCSLMDAVRQKAAIAERAANRMLQALLASAYSAWVDLVQTARWRRSTLQKVHGRLKNRAIAQAFAAWLQMLAEIKWQRNAVAKVLGRLRNRVAAEAFLAWHGEVARALATRQETLRQVGNLLIQRTTALTFQAWREQVEQTKEVRARARHLAGRMLHTLTGRCFDAWSEFVADQQRIFLRAAQAIGPGRLMWIAFSTWMQNVRDAIEERERDQERLFMLGSLDERMAAYIASTVQTQLPANIEQVIHHHVSNPLREAMESMEAELNSRITGLESVRRPAPPISAKCKSHELICATFARFRRTCFRCRASQNATVARRWSRFCVECGMGCSRRRWTAGSTW